MAERSPDPDDAARAPIPAPAPDPSVPPSPQPLDAPFRAARELPEVGDLTRAAGSPLAAAAIPLLALAARLRTATGDNDAGAVQDIVGGELAAFADVCRAAGVQPDTLRAVRHAIAALLDEAMTGAPWAADSDGHPLPIRSFNVDDDEDAFHAQVARMAEDPGADLDALRVIHDCLSLRATAPGPAGSDDRREKIRQVLRSRAGASPLELSPEGPGFNGPNERRHRIRRTLASPAGYAAGATLLSLAAWFGFRALANAGVAFLGGPWPTAAAIAVIVLLCALRPVLDWRRTRRLENALADGIARIDPGNGAIDAWQLEVQERLKAILADFRRTGGKHAPALLHRIPWYVVIGPPGTGKTTAVRNSGLRSPLEARHGMDLVRGIGGTRRCEFWFLEKAVIIDTAGRWVMQDSDAAADQAEWRHFLEVLKHTRGPQPLNGVVMMVALPALLDSPLPERGGLARALGARLAELQADFGDAPPVHVVLTKLDRIAGFVEYFDDLDREGREQVLGVTLPQGPAGVPHRQFPAAFDRLVARLRARLPDRLHEERDLQRRTSIHGFPSQFASLGRVVEDLLAEVFGDSRLAGPPALRGVYFTSGTQEGRPIDRLMDFASARLDMAPPALPPHAGAGRGYFLHRLFDDVIIGAGRADPRACRRRTPRPWPFTRPMTGGEG